MLMSVVTTTEDVSICVGTHLDITPAIVYLDMVSTMTAAPAVVICTFCELCADNTIIHEFHA